MPELEINYLLFIYCLLVPLFATESSTPAVPVAKFACHPVLHLDLWISQRIFEKFEMTLMFFSVLGGRWFMKKTWSNKSRNTVSLKGAQPDYRIILLF